MALRRPDGFAGFSLLWLGQILSALGTRMTNFALSIWVWQATGQATDLTLLLAFAFIPTVVFSPIAGSLIDRWNRRLAVLVSDVGSAVATGALVLMFLTGPVHMWQLYAVNAVTGMFLAFQVPAFSSTITLMMGKRHYPRANAMMFAARFAPVIVAPGLAAALLPAAGVKLILLLDTLSYVVAIATVFAVRIPRTPRAADDQRLTLWRDSLYGFGYIARRRPLAWLQAMMFAINLFAAIGYALLFALILARTGGDEAQVGIAATVGAIGGLTGAMLLATLPPTAHKMRRILLGILVFSLIGRILYGVADSLVMWGIAILFVHLCIPIIDGYAQAIWQEKVEPKAQGRVFGARQFIEDLTVPIGALVAGPVADRFFEPWLRPGAVGAELFGGLVGTGPGAGIGLIFVIVGVLGVGVAVVGYLVPSIRRVETLLPDAVDDAPAERADAPDSVPHRPVAPQPALATE